MNHCCRSCQEGLIQAVPEGEEGICGSNSSVRGQAVLLRLLCPKAGGVHPANLAGSYADGLILSGVDQGIGLDILGYLPGKTEGPGLRVCGGSSGHHPPLLDVAGIKILQHHTPEYGLFVVSPIQFALSLQQVSYVQDPAVGLLLREEPQGLCLVTRSEKNLNEAVPYALGRLHVHHPVETYHPSECRLGISGKGESEGLIKACAIGHAAGIGMLYND